jgi:DNA-binding NtrC family response regulator
MPDRQTVLVVDDDLCTRESLRMSLNSSYQVCFAENGVEALQNIHSNQNINIVLLDLEMPGISGMDVLQEVRKFRSDIEVIVITAYGTSENAQEAFHSGARGFFSKPFTVREIIDEVARALVWRKYCLKLKKVINHIQTFPYSVHDGIKILSGPCAKYAVIESRRKPFFH